LRIVRYYHFINYIFLVILLSCDKSEEEYSYNLDGTRYPKGIVAVDLNSSNDCSLAKCDTNRLSRLTLNNVQGIVTSDTIIVVSFTFDSKIRFHICSEKLSNFNPGDNVSFSGEGKDGCGYLHNVYPFEEEYFLFLNKIKKL